MQHRTLGQQGLSVSAIGYGAMGIHLAYGPGDEQEALAALRRALELGVTFVDTAELYGWGENEKFIGRAVKSFRGDVVIATKFGFSRDYRYDSRPEHIREVVDNSLRYLDTDYIDVLYQHRVDPSVPIEQVAGTVKEFIDAGKVRFFGLSEAGPETIRKAHDVHPVSVLQTEYSLFERDVEALFPTLNELGIGLVAYSPLGRGFLTGTAQPPGAYDSTDMRRSDPRWQPGNYERNRDTVRQLSDLAASRHVTVSQLALAWLLDQGEHIVPIPGTRRAARVEENVAAVNLTLTDSDRAVIRDILPTGGSGARYVEGRVPVWV